MIHGPVLVTEPAVGDTYTAIVVFFFSFLNNSSLHKPKSSITDQKILVHHTFPELQAGTWDGLWGGHEQQSCPMIDSLAKIQFNTSLEVK